MRKELRHQVTRRLLHVLPDLDMSGRSAFVSDLLQHMPAYLHTVVVLGGLERANQTLAWSMQAAGAELLYADGKYPYSPSRPGYSAVIVYGASAAAFDPGPDVPCVYYAYHGFDAEMRKDVLLAPSARVQAAVGGELVAPGIRVRTMRRLGRPKDAKYTVAMMSSGYGGKYPFELLRGLNQLLPRDIRLIVTAHPELRSLRAADRLWAVPVMAEATLKGIYMANAVVYATADGHPSEYGRTCLEAMAARRPVVCLKAGNMGDMLQDGVHALMFDTAEQAADKIMYLRQHQDEADKLAATGQVLASWHDMSVQVGELRGILNALGA